MAVIRQKRCYIDPQKVLLNDGISILVRRAPRAYSLSLPCEDTARKSPSANQEGSAFQTQPCCHSDLGLPTSRVVRNVCFFQKIYSKVCFSPLLSDPSILIFDHHFNTNKYHFYSNPDLSQDLHIYIKAYKTSL